MQYNLIASENRRESMAGKKLLWILGLSIQLSYGAVMITKWADLPVGGIRTDTIGNWTYDQTKANDFVLKDRIFFASSSSRLSINATISGNWNNNTCGMIFCLDTQKNIVFNPGHLSFSINSEQVAQSSTGLFQLKNKASLEINSDFSITATQTSQFDQGVFNLQDASLQFINSNLSLDFSNNQNKIILFNLGRDANVTINGNSSQKTVILKGGIKVEDAKFELNLSNKQSNFEGFVELKGTSTFLLKLTNSQTTLTDYTENLNGTGQANFELNQSILNAKITGKQTDLNLSSSSVWNIFNSSETRDLTLQNSQIDFMQDPQGNRFGQTFVQKTLQANSLKGNGIFKLYADLGQKQIDTLNLQNAEGHHQIQVFYNPKTFSQILAQSINEQSNIVIANIANASQAVFEGGKTEMGLVIYQTNLKKITQNAQQTQWVISSIVPSGYSTLSKVLTTALNTPYRLFDLTNSVLALRLGDLRNYPKDYGLHFRIATGLNQLKETANTLKMQESWMHFSGGFDSNQIYFQRVDFFGIGLDITSLDSKHLVFALKSQAYGINLYYTSIFDNRFYFDLILKYSFSSSRLQSDQNLNFQTHLIHLGVEIGKKIAIGNHQNFFYIEPQSKITTGVILPLHSEFKDQNQEQIKGRLQTQFPLIIRSSFYLGYEWNTDLRGDLKFGSFAEYSLKNGGKILLSDPRNSIEREFKSDFDVGITAIGSIEIQKSWRFYLGLDSSFLGNYTTDITFNAGVRWSFGDRYIPPPPSNPSTNPDRLKIRYKPNISRRTIPLIKEDEIQQMKHYDRRNISTQQNRNKNRLYPSTSVKNPPIKIEGQKEYNRDIKRD